MNSKFLQTFSLLSRSTASLPWLFHGEFTYLSFLSQSLCESSEPADVCNSEFTILCILMTVSAHDCRKRIKLHVLKSQLNRVVKQWTNKVRHYEIKKDVCKAHLWLTRYHFSHTSNMAKQITDVCSRLKYSSSCWTDYHETLYICSWSPYDASCCDLSCFTINRSKLKSVHYFGFWLSPPEPKCFHYNISCILFLCQTRIVNILLNIDKLSCFHCCVRLKASHLPAWLKTF